MTLKNPYKIMPTEQSGFSSPITSNLSDLNAVGSGNTRQMTFGEKLVGLTFNPSNDDKVNQAKKLCAQLADLLYEDCKQSETSELKNILVNPTYASILNAQMNVVKILTLKY